PQMDLVEGSVAGVESGTATVAVGDMRMNFVVNGAGSKLASKATIGIRPRAFVPVNVSSADTMTVTAELIEPMGAETLIHARGKAGEDIWVVVPRQMKIKVGEVMNLR